jgi:hypothetical protein
MAVKHGYCSRFFADRFDISGDLNDVTWGAERPMADVTGFCAEAKEYIPGQHSWKVDVKGWHDSQGSVSAAGSTQPDGTAGSDLALYYLGNLGTAPSPMNKVIGFFPGGPLGTTSWGWAGIGGLTTRARASNIGNAVGISASFQGNSPLTHVRVLWAGTVNTTAGTGHGISLGTPPPPAGQNGAYCYFGILGTVGGNGTAQVVGTVRASDTLGGVYTDIARYSGTAAGAYAIQATVTSGSVPAYVNFAYRTSDASDDTAAGTAQGTIVAAIGLIPPLR